MIKLKCKKCESFDIWDIGDEYEASVFRCNNCDYEFEINISADSFEFDNE